MVSHCTAIAHFDLLKFFRVTLYIEVSGDVVETAEVVLMSGAVGESEIPYGQNHRDLGGDVVACCGDGKFSFVKAGRHIFRNTDVHPYWLVLSLEKLEGDGIHFISYCGYWFAPPFCELAGRLNRFSAQRIYKGDERV